MKVAVAFLASIASVVRAAAVPRATDPTPVSAATIATFKPYSFFAAAGYCTPDTTLAWSCGGEQRVHSGASRLKACSQLPGPPRVRPHGGRRLHCDYLSHHLSRCSFLPTASGGDGSDVQFCAWQQSCHPSAHLALVGFVGFHPALNSVLVVHQGTDPSEM